MKISKVIGIIWLIFSFLYFYNGFQYLYGFSESGILWVFVIPIAVTYTKIGCGILCLLIGIKFVKNKPENNYLILPLTFLLLIYLITGINQYGISTIFLSGENALLLTLIATSYCKLKRKMEITDMTAYLKENILTVIGILVLGFIPDILSGMITYDFYKFLH